MSELLYNKSKAVEELNKVEGFYPLELARVISNEGQEEQRYLDVKYRKLWFRLVNPTGKIISRIVHFTENMAVVEAEFIWISVIRKIIILPIPFHRSFVQQIHSLGINFLKWQKQRQLGELWQMRGMVCNLLM